MSQRRSYIAAAELGGQIYAAGGMVGETGRPLATVSRYDPRRDTWATLAPLPEPTRAPRPPRSAGASSSPAGRPPAGNVTTVISLDPRARRLARAPVASRAALQPRAGRRRRAALRDRRLPRRPRAARRVRLRAGAGRWRRGDAAAAARPMRSAPSTFRGEIWVVGGRRGEDVLREVWILDPRTERWRRGPAMPRPMELLGLAVRGRRAPCRVGVDLPGVRRAARELAPGAAPGRDAARARGVRVGGALYTVGGCTTALRDSPVVERLRLSSPGGV